MADAKFGELLQIHGLSSIVDDHFSNCQKCKKLNVYHGIECFLSLDGCDICKSWRSGSQIAARRLLLLDTTCREAIQSLIFSFLRDKKTDLKICIGSLWGDCKSQLCASAHFPHILPLILRKGPSSPTSEDPMFKPVACDRFLGFQNPGGLTPNKRTGTLQIHQLTQTGKELYFRGTLATPEIVHPTDRGDLWVNTSKAFVVFDNAMQIMRGHIQVRFLCS